MNISPEDTRRGVKKKWHNDLCGEYQLNCHTKFAVFRGKLAEIREPVINKKFLRVVQGGSFSQKAPPWPPEAHFAMGLA